MLPEMPTFYSNLAASQDEFVNKLLHKKANIARIVC